MLEFFFFYGISALLYLGGFAERSIGVPRYIFVYLISGIAGALLHGIVASYVLGNGDIVLIGASGAISGVLGIAAGAGNAKAYYWLMLQVVFAIIGAFTSIPTAFTAHVGRFVAGFLLAKVLMDMERNKKHSIRNTLKKMVDFGEHREQ